MILLDITLSLAFAIDLKGAVLFAVENAAAIRDLSAAVLAILKAREILREDNKNK
ncbi:hypothetical protein [Pseudoalteromonas luteoviolacea]|uniref:hypothetical protein n=1 Tax=Pseudoalteromonas luteoviolacea TaxID=43657 RepID=UPI00163C7CBA|nr:hypothetical protein [Pseudoalteromonas luteoviolacea]